MFTPFCSDISHDVAYERLYPTQKRVHAPLIALETAHAIAALRRTIDLLVTRGVERAAIVVCLSGRGDKDMSTLIERLDLDDARGPR